MTRLSRRREDRCLVVKLWNQATPYIQMLGWVIIVLGVFGAATLQYGKVQAYDDRIAKLEQDNEKQMILLQRIDQRLSDMYDRSK